MQQPAKNFKFDEEVWRKSAVKLNEGLPEGC
jgi:hypothetical protein